MALRQSAGLPPRSATGVLNDATQPESFEDPDSDVWASLPAPPQVSRPRPGTPPPADSERRASPGMQTHTPPATSAEQPGQGELPQCRLRGGSPATRTSPSPTDAPNPGVPQPSDAAASDAEPSVHAQQPPASAEARAALATARSEAAAASVPATLPAIDVPPAAQAAAMSLVALRAGHVDGARLPPLAAQPPPSDAHTDAAAAPSGAPAASSDAESGQGADEDATAPCEDPELEKRRCALRITPPSPHVLHAAVCLQHRRRGAARAGPRARRSGSVRARRSRTFVLLCRTWRRWCSRCARARLPTVAHACSTACGYAGSFAPPACAALARAGSSTPASPVNNAPQGPPA